MKIKHCTTCNKKLRMPNYCLWCREDILPDKPCADCGDLVNVKDHKWIECLECHKRYCSNCKWINFRNLLTEGICTSCIPLLEQEDSNSSHHIICKDLDCDACSMYNNDEEIHSRQFYVSGQEITHRECVF